MRVACGADADSGVYVLLFHVVSASVGGRPEAIYCRSSRGMHSRSSEVLARIGGIAAIRDQLIDDCALARAVKPGGAIWLGATRKAASVRGYGGWSDIGRMISRSAFNQIGHSVWLLACAVVGMAIVYLAPPVLLGFGGWASGLGLAAWLAMAIAYWPTLRFYRLAPFWAALLPVVAGFYLVATMRSAVQYWRGRGGEWKGRIQDSA